MILDAKDLLVGRFATVVAKKALLGEEIIILNCDSAVISGSPKQIEAKYKRLDSMGTPAKGPFIPKQSHYLVKRMIRGMIPYKTSRGRDALARIKCFVGVPEEYADKKAETIAQAKVTKLPLIKYTSVKKVALSLGGKQ